MLRKYRILGLCLSVILLTAMSSCGKTGDLYLPDDKPGKSASVKP